MTFEEAIPIIDEQLKRQQKKWKLKATPWMDYDDVSQLIRLHIYKKWDKYDQSQPLAPWVSRVISHQIWNMLRNHYGNVVSPCSGCASKLQNNGCEIYGEVGLQCPMYKNWFYNKKAKYDIKLPVPLETHQGEVYDMFEEGMIDSFNIEKFHERMRQSLKLREWEIYELLYLSKGGCEKSLGVQYRQIQSLKKKFYAIAKEIINEQNQ